MILWLASCEAEGFVIKQEAENTQSKETMLLSRNEKIM